MTHPDDVFGRQAEDRAVQAEIRERAYCIWAVRGQRQNSQLDDWLEAESEILGDSE